MNHCDSLIHILGYNLLFTGMYGLAVDNLIQVEVVTADGKARIINSCKRSDLFWAIRGGGGGSFGVVTKAWYKIHKK